MASTGDRLLAAARAHVVATLDADELRRVVVLTAKGRKLSLDPSCLDSQLPVVEPEMPPGHRPFSSLEHTVMKALKEASGWMTAQQLADATGQSKSSYFTAILTNLADAEVIESLTGRGYRLPLTAASALPN